MCDPYPEEEYPLLAPAFDLSELGAEINEAIINQLTEERDRFRAALVEITTEPCDASHIIAYRALGVNNPWGDQ